LPTFEVVLDAVVKNLKERDFMFTRALFLSSTMLAASFAQTTQPHEFTAAPQKTQQAQPQASNGVGQAFTTAPAARSTVEPKAGTSPELVAAMLSNPAAIAAGQPVLPAPAASPVQPSGARAVPSKPSVAPALATAASSSTEVYLDCASITRCDAYYSQDVVRIWLDIPAVSNGCPGPNPDSYVTDPTSPGSKLQEATLLGACLAHKKVCISLSGCSSTGLPRIDNVGVDPSS
jgi:hypothetical protein